MKTIAAIIVGIDGWEQYTLPLADSIKRYEPECEIVIHDNLSNPPYPLQGEHCVIGSLRRYCYSAAINQAAAFADVRCKPDWYIVLSNDVICTGPFAALIEATPDDRIVGPHRMVNQGYDYLEGWCVCIPRRVWNAVGGWDENYRLSSWEDVDYSYMAREAGFAVEHRPDLPFVHLDQRQRHAMPTFWQDDSHNYRYFREKRERRAVGQANWRRQPYVPAIECHQ